MASDSRFLDAVGFSRFLDVVDAEWASERLPQEDVAAAAAAAGAVAAAVAAGDAIPYVLMEGFGGLKLADEDDAGAEFAAGLGGLSAAERERRDLEWSDPGIDLLLMQSASATGAMGPAATAAAAAAGGGSSASGGGHGFTEEEGILAAAALAAASGGGGGGKGGGSGAIGAGGVFGGEDVLFQLLDERMRARGNRAQGSSAPHAGRGSGVAGDNDDDGVGVGVEGGEEGDDDGFDLASRLARETEGEIPELRWGEEDGEDG